jgi:hypothetical protein
MGVNASKSLSEVVNESTMEVSTNYTSNFEQSQFQGAVLNQVNKLNIGEINGCCNIDFSNDGDISQLQQGQLNEDQTIQIIDDLANKLESTFDEMIEQEAQPLPGINVADTVSKVKNEMRTILNSDVLSETIQSTSQTAYNLQGNEIEIDTITCPCKLDENGNVTNLPVNSEPLSKIGASNQSTMAQISEVAAEKIMDFVKNTSIESDLESLFSKKLSQKTGFDFGLLAAVIGGAILLIIIIIVALKSGGRRRRYMMY